MEKKKKVRVQQTMVIIQRPSSVLPAVSEERITESGELRITEDGQQRVTEGS